MMIQSNTINTTQPQSSHHIGKNIDNVDTIWMEHNDIKEDANKKINGRLGSSEQSLPSLNKIKSTEELEIDFKQNQKILSSLNLNIDDLFKKISQLTDEVSIKTKQTTQNQLQNYPIPQYATPLSYFNTQQKYLKYEELLRNQTHKTQQDKLDVEIGISMKRFQTGKTLGYGKFGEVLQCRHYQTGMLFALKKIFKSALIKYKMEGQMMVEIIAQKRMNHPNIIKSYKSFTDPFHVFIIMEYVQGVQLITKFKQSQQFVSRVIKQVLQAVGYMHNQGVIHRDLKPENILITADSTIKICDFGWSSVDGNQLNILCGTLDYLSPEMAHHKCYSKNVDLWSIGVLTYQLIYGEPPFKGQSKEDTIQKIKKIQLKFPQETEVSEQCKQFIKSFLRHEQLRSSVKEGLQHIFIQKYIQNNDTNIFDGLL